MVKRYYFNIFVLCFVLFLVACSDNSSPDQGTAGDGDESLSVGYYVNSLIFFVCRFNCKIIFIVCVMSMS